MFQQVLVTSPFAQSLIWLNFHISGLTCGKPENRPQHGPFLAQVGFMTIYHSISVRCLPLTIFFLQYHQYIPSMIGYAPHFKSSTIFAGEKSHIPWCFFNRFTT